ncbi:MAG: hypothetical protein H7842_06795 [Gammaproteobacteria bacterium SHHR-1]|uniref:hypothetical protein n=1 Tax=Magnetovirga frankeli TaxID=947516 RepID=UPI00129395AA|nr:hypothetical protein D5125_12160 [gamma proteobacterium SS-5]
MNVRTALLMAVACLPLSACDNARNTNSITQADMDGVRTESSRAHAATAQTETHHRVRDSWYIVHP